MIPRLGVATMSPVPDTSTNHYRTGDTNMNMESFTAGQRRRIERVSVAAKANARARKQLDVAVLAARKDGLSQRAIAEAAGFTHRSIQRILEKHEAA